MNRKQRRRALALYRKAQTKKRLKWENAVVAEMTAEGIAERQVRKHMKTIKGLPDNVADALRSLTPSAYVKSILQEMRALDDSSDESSEV